jgi:PAS domain S-box-containing protein
MGNAAAPRMPAPAPVQPGDDPVLLRLADHLPVMIWRADASKRFDFFNRFWLEFTGRSMEEEAASGWADTLHPEDAARILLELDAAFEARRGFSLDYRRRRWDGLWRWVRDSAHPRFVNGVFAGYLGSCVDITDAREAIEHRQHVERERDALLVELKHRVKNNMQATTSFLSLQANRAPDPAIATALRSAATRVLLASLVQDRMFRLQPHARVVLGEEIEAAARAAWEAAGRQDVALEIGPLSTAPTVPASQATPLSLIVTELVVNAVRHAFPDGSSGRIRVGLSLLPTGRAEIRVEDDGVGLPDAVRVQVPRHCLGLHMAPRLARQARGTLRFEGPPGTMAVLTFTPAG